MKRQLTVALGLAVIATPAFATKARLEALGEDTFGSYYIQDNRNIFLNPARITENKDFVTYEFGASGSAVAGADSAAAPRAGGGFAKSHGNMVYGLNFGDSSPSTGQVRALGGTQLQEVQPWDFHIGGDSGLKWGTSFTYEQFDGTTGAGNRLASHGLRVRGGVLMGDLDLFAQVSLKNDAKDFNGTSVKGDNGIFLGAGYMVNNYKLFVDYRMIGAEYRGTTTVAGAKEDIDTGILRVGAGRQERLNDRATLFAKAMVTRTAVDDDGGATASGLTGTATTTGAKVTSYALPVNVGLEYAATSWLDLRASVVNNVWSSNEVKPKGGSKTKQHVANTAVRAGASIKFGEFSIDGLISNDTGANGVADQSDASVSAGGNLRTDSLLTRVSMIYRF